MHACEEIDAEGQVVTPGFVDIHTHYDGQVTWENRLAPSSFHGVTTVVMGNCGVGFAPCRPDQHEMLIQLMEGVEDIPHPVLVDGLPWTWETYPQYLDFLATRQYDMDVCGYVPHAPMRVYVMGQRGADREPATDQDLQQMARIVRDAMQAGAMGFSTSRTFFHRSSDGKSTPSFEAAENELLALALALKESGKGAMQLITDFDDPDQTLALLRRMVERSGRPLSVSLLEGTYGPMTLRWRDVLDWAADATASGLPIKAQVLSRAIGVMLGHELTLNTFYTCESYVKLAGLPFKERIRALNTPEMRARILAESADPNPTIVLGRLAREFDHMFILGDPPDYEQPFEQSIAARAKRAGVMPEELVYDLMLEGEGRNNLYVTLCNYEHGSLESSLNMMQHPGAVLGLGDAGAHCGTICDGSYPTFMLTYWVRDRKRGERLPLARVVKWLSHDTARAVGLLDRCVIAPGYKADLNVIDLDRLLLHAPEVVYDLPSGGRRLVQRADGYSATIVSGTVVHRGGVPTGSLPGRLVRGPQPAARH
ncbi:MAG TPA: amidohydrolase family protein [Candidatus Methylomirabilis sp.]|nr:amidohydrolase family protein [Candidatus Methylomirabilis sp.]